MRSIGWLSVVGLALFQLACGGGGSGGYVGSGSYAAKCAQACQAPTNGPCAGQDTGACESQCVIATDGLSTLCAQCVVENSYWGGVKCSCYGSGCCAHPFGGRGLVTSCSTNDTCAQSDEHCSGFKIQKAT